MPPCQRYPQVPSLAQTGTPNLTFFCEPLLWIVSRREMAIKHLMYTQLCAFMGPVWFLSGFGIHLGRFL